MKKIIKAILILILVIGLGVFMVFRTPGNPSKYDEPGYIGAADIALFTKMVMGISREEMSSFLIEGDTAHMAGVISGDTIRQIEKLIKDYPEVKNINMVDVDGSIDDVSNLVASRLVRKAGFNTHVAKDGHIASGGTDFFCAGVKRTAEEGAKVGVHSWAGNGVTDASKLERDHKEHKKYIDYYKEMEMLESEAFYFFTINAAKADGMHYMSMDELKKYGLIQ